MMVVVVPSTVTLVPLLITKVLVVDTAMPETFLDRWVCANIGFLNILLLTLFQCFLISQATGNCDKWTIGTCFIPCTDRDNCVTCTSTNDGPACTWCDATQECVTTTANATCYTDQAKCANFSGVSAVSTSLFGFLVVFLVAFVMV